MRRTTPILVSALLVLVAGTAFFVHRYHRSPPLTAASDYRLSDAENYGVGQINGARAEYSRGRLVTDKTLSYCAHRHSVEMASRHKVYHSSDYALLHCRTDGSQVGENVGYGATLYDVFHSFLNSDDHRHTLMYRTYDRVGVGVARDDRGLYYVTEIFWAE